ncbi:hypothetical protein [Reyranella sp.]|uniref:hypothetical protein n=1 Tax=Reyranella sp. TaxID=1929291 RepID=UPI003BA99CF8
MDEERKKRLLKTVPLDPLFLGLYGAFHSAFGSLDVTIDIGIGKLLKIGIEETHIITTAIDFSRRAQMLSDLVALQNHPQKAAILSAIKTIQNEAKRNAFAHSYLSGNEDTVTFIHRHRENTLKPKRHTYSRESFAAHVGVFMKAASDLQEALGISNDDFSAFTIAEESDSQSYTTSPKPPSAKA